MSLAPVQGQPSAASQNRRCASRSFTSSTTAYRVRGCATSEQRAGQLAARAQHGWVTTVDRVEESQQVFTQAIATRGVEPLEQRDQPVEGGIGLAAEDVHVAERDVAVDVVRVRGQRALQRRF